MANNYFRFKQFTIYQDRCAFRVGTDGVLLGAYADTAGAVNILDIGTGTGLIALMLAQRCRASFEQALGNVEISGWKSRIKVIHTDLQNFIPEGGMKFDLIVSNPPYFRGSLRNPDTRKAMTRHDSGLLTRDILDSVDRLLDDKGRLQLIMPYPGGAVFIAEAREHGLFCHDLLKIKSSPASAVSRLIISLSRMRLATGEKFLTIGHGENHQFTEEYRNLTRDFYLKF
jgi:tRNA1Val (adenine37-N6)-methyltransferase